jgi:predicted AAA+ superfamily ATPase
LEQAGLHFVLLGSSARKLKTAGTNLLAGRALQKTLYPFTPEELGKDFHLEDVLHYGSLPLVWQSQTKQETLQAYVQLYLREEIRAESLVRNLPGFTRFLPIAALFHGQTLNVQSLARDAGVARTTVSGYLDILEDTLLTFRLPPFEAKLRVRERKHPKLYWVDPGIVRAVKRQFGPVSAEERGALLEGWVAVLLHIYGEYRNLCEECFYWSPTESHATEVDFLLRRGRQYLALEVKATKNIASSHLGGLRAIADLQGLARRVLVYSGARRLRSEEGIDIYPVEAFLEALAGDTLWPA